VREGASEEVEVEATEGWSMGGPGAEWEWEWE